MPDLHVHVHVDWLQNVWDMAGLRSVIRQLSALWPCKQSQVTSPRVHTQNAAAGGIREPVLARYTRQLLEGLAYLHSKEVMHRDIKVC